ncbi:MAG: CBS domain-containing protein [Nitrospiraceae bacterium]|nr:CBS domain-containing protein [Nitrospiraceae bacterium]
MGARRKQARRGTKPSAVAFGDLTVDAIMEKRVQSAVPGAKADGVARMMLKGFGAVPIVDKGKRLMGVVSEHDLLAALDGGQGWARVTAKDVMSVNPYSVRPETTVGTLIHVLKESDLIRVPVVNAQNKLVGVVARRDVVRAALKHGLKRAS